MFIRVIGAAVVCALAASAAAHAQTCPTSGVSQLVVGNLARAEDLNNNFACLAPKASPQFTGGISISNVASGVYGIDLTASGNAQLGLHVSNPNSGSSANSAIILGNNTNSNGVSIWLNSSNDTSYGGANALNMINALNGNFLLGTGGGGQITMVPGGGVGMGWTPPSGYELFVAGAAGGDGAWVNLSDARLKTAIEPISGGLDIVSRLRPVRFQWRASADRAVGKDLPLNPSEKHVGFIAQEVQAVLPEAVVAPKDANGTYGLKEGDMVPVLVQAIKELKQQVDDLKAQVAQLRQAQ